MFKDFFGKTAYEAYNAAKIVGFFTTFSVDKIHSQSTCNFTIVGQNSEQIQGKILSRTVG